MVGVEGWWEGEALEFSEDEDVGGGESWAEKGGGTVDDPEEYRRSLSLQTQEAMQ